MPRRARPKFGRGHPKNGPKHENHVGRPMIRCLLASYSIEQIQKMFEEEGCPLSSSSSSSSSLLLSPPLENDDEDSISPEPKTKPQATLPDAANDGFSESNHISFPSVAADRSPASIDIALPDNTIVHRREEVARIEQAPSTSTNEINDNASRETSYEWQKEYPCGFCNEHGIKTNFTRKSDLKRHLERKHHTNNLWICSPKNCRRVFQWLGAYKAHVRGYHKSRIKISDVETLTLCPQTVFACGFEGCIKVYEAPSEFDTGPTKMKFITHVLNHFRYMKEPKPWTFTLRIRNLLRQGELFKVWPPPSLPYEEKVRLNWDAQTGSVLQKLLETRHLGDLNSLVKNVIALGSNPSKEVQLAQGNIAVPILGECQAEVHQQEMLAAQFTVLPMMPVNVNVEPINVDYGAGAPLTVTDYTDIPNGSYQPQPLMYQDPMQEMLNSLIVQPVEQQYLSTDYTGPMEWLDYDEESDDFV